GGARRRALGPEARTRDPAAVEHVLHRVEVVAGGEALVDDLDAEGRRLPRAPDAHGPALPVDRAGVWLVGAGDDLHRHRLAGAVVTDQGCDHAARHGEVDAAEAVHRAEALLDALEPQERPE